MTLEIKPRASTYRKMYAQGLRNVVFSSRNWTGMELQRVVRSWTSSHLDGEGRLTPC